MDAPPLIPFAPPPGAGLSGASNDPRIVVSGQDNGATTASLEQQPRPAGPGRYPFAIVLQQLLTLAHGVSASVEDATPLPNDPLFVSAGRQLLSADGKFLPLPNGQPISMAASSIGPTHGETHKEEEAGRNGLPWESDLVAVLPLVDTTEAPTTVAAAPGAFDASTKPRDGLGLATSLAALAAQTRTSAEPVPPPSAVADVPDQSTSGVGAVPAGTLDASPTTATVTSSQTATTAIPVPPSESGWSEALGERVLWLIGNRISAARLSLSPPDLGPLEVRIILDGDKAHVLFASAHSHVREALEGALPRLKEMLGEAGIQLFGAEVGDARSGMAHHTPTIAVESTLHTEDDEPPVAGATAPVRITKGLLDLYA